MLKILAIDDNQDNLTSLRAIVADAFPKVRFWGKGTAPEGPKERWPRIRT
ncbi:MAG: hypothetical protein WCP58_06435 [bacterium]